MNRAGGFTRESDHHEEAVCYIVDVTVKRFTIHTHIRSASAEKRAANVSSPFLVLSIYRQGSLASVDDPPLFLSSHVEHTNEPFNVSHPSAVDARTRGGTSLSSRGDF